MKPIQESAMNVRGDNHTTHPAGLRREKEGKMEQRNKIPKTCVECDFLEYKSGEFVCTRLPFHFVYYPMEQGVAGVILKAKNYKNALRNAKKWAKENGKTITGNAPGYEYQSKDL